jgi:hypothetical protein
MPVGYDRVSMEFFGRGVSIEENLLMRYNGDLTSTNYQFQNISSSANLPIIGRISASNAVFKGSCIIEFYNLQQSVRRASTGLSHTNSGTATATGLASFFGHVWESSATIETVNFAGFANNIAAGSFVNVYAYEEREVLVESPATEYDWSMTFDFSVDDYSEVFESQQGEYVTDEYRTDGSELDYVQVYFPEFGGALSDTLSVLRVELTYFIESGETDSSIGFHAVGFAPTDVFSSPILDAETTHVFDYGTTEQVADNFAFFASYDDFTSVNAYAAIRKIVLRGVGAVPSELTSYVD